MTICSDHHEFAHNGLIKNENTDNPHLQINGQPNETDQLYLKYRQQALL